MSRCISNCQPLEMEVMSDLPKPLKEASVPRSSPLVLTMCVLSAQALDHSCAQVLFLCELLSACVLERPTSSHALQRLSVHDIVLESQPLKEATFQKKSPSMLAGWQKRTFRLFPRGLVLFFFWLLAVSFCLVFSCCLC